MGFFSGITGGLGSSLASSAIQTMDNNPAYQIGGAVNAVNNFLQRGDILGAAGLLGFGGQENDLFAGASLGHTKRMHKEMMGIDWERKNRFFIEILDMNPLPMVMQNLPPQLRAPMMAASSAIKGALGKLNTMTSGFSGALVNQAMGLLKGSSKFNVYAMDVSYSPITIEGEPINIGSAVIDNVTTTAHVDISVTCRDDKYGTIKKWADGKASQVAQADGTFGLPADYALNIRILHGYVGDDVALGRGYSQSFVCRISSVEISKSRSDNGLNDLQIKFTQIDTMRMA